MIRRALILCAVSVAAALAGAAPVDVVVLKNGKKLEGVVSRNDDEYVVINPWNSRLPEMTWEIPEKNRVPKEKVAEVILADAPLIEYRRRAGKPGLTSAEHLALAHFCEEHKLKDERERHLQLARALDPESEEARSAYADSKYERWAKGNPVAHPELSALEREYVALEDPAELKQRWTRMKELSTKRKLVYLERSRRSAALPAGRREKVAFTHRSDEVPGATYCIYVPNGYDPLTPTPLVVGLHGGGRGGKDETLVTGSGEDAMPFYQGQAERWGWIVVCPTARAAPWSALQNEALFEVLLEEMALLYNVDETRVYVTGHSMGGFGTWYWGPKMAETWAAMSPCAGGGGPNGVQSKGLSVYIYHGADDNIVGPSWDRQAAKSFGGGRKPFDFVYTELDGVGHGFPAEVRADIFRFFAGRWRDDGRKRATAPVSSFLRKVSKAEVETFGDPSELPEAGEGDARLKDLVEALERGGAGGQAVVEEFGRRKDRATVKAVARLLKPKKTSTDTRVLAARTLGLIGTKDVIKPLRGALDDDDYRVLDEVVTALGKTGLAAAAAPLSTAAKQVGERYDASFLGSNRMTHTEYAIRLQSFGRLCDAFVAVADADAALPALERELVERIFTPDEKPVDTQDPRFVREPPAARLALCERLTACLVALGDRRGVAILEAVGAAWPEQPSLGDETARGVERLTAELDG